MAGVFNLVGGLTGTAVALTIGTGLVEPGVLSLVTMVAALAGAMAWSLFTYFFGIPVSEIHGLIGGLTPKYPLVTSYPAAADAAGTYLQQALRCPAAKRPRPSNCVVR
jgi:Phosphate transporter family